MVFFNFCSFLTLYCYFIKLFLLLPFIRYKRSYFQFFLHCALYNVLEIRLLGFGLLWHCRCCCMCGRVGGWSSRAAVLSDSTSWWAAAGAASQLTGHHSRCVSRDVPMIKIKQNKANEQMSEHFCIEVQQDSLCNKYQVCVFTLFF